jgi:predicted O-methyltransferase YrrM
MLNKIRYLRHPYLISRAITRPFDVRDSMNHCVRQQEYLNHEVNIHEAVKLLTGCPVSEQQLPLQEIETVRLVEHINQCALEVGQINAGFTTEMGSLLYLLVRLTNPNVVVETGVASGISSAFILSALDKNRKGRLYSVDLHYRDGIFTPAGKELGWVIPDRLRERWTLLLGEGVKVFPKLLTKTGKIDMFLHDSSHLYKAMSTEYRLMWPNLREGGLLLSDDVSVNDAFLDFADKYKQAPIVFRRMGAIAKKTILFPLNR